MNRFASFLLAFLFLNLSIPKLYTTTLEEQKKLRMVQDLAIIKHHLETGYAPAIWKKEYSGWDLDESFEYYKNKILLAPTIHTKQFQKIVRDFLNTTKDYHVEVMFFSTEAASLPFTIKGAQGRYFISWIDPLRIPPSHYAIHIGDELLEFDEKPISEVMETLINEYGKSSSRNTDQTMAEMKLTLRAGVAGDVVPKGPIIIKTRSTDSQKPKTFQLHWTYITEHVRNPFDFLPLLDSIGWEKSAVNIPSIKKFKISKFKMVNPLHEFYAKKMADRQAGFGSTKSFVPMLGELIWVKETNDDNEMNILEAINFEWYAYIYRHPNGQVIGYIRIPHYMGFSMHAQEFGEILNFMETNTDALVIDQLHNFGGYVLFQYELASMLATDPLKTPHHRIKITQKEVLDAFNKIREIGKLLEELNKHQAVEENPSIESDKGEGEELAIELQREVDVGFNYQQILFLKSYYELILDEWNKAKTLTRPTPILGIDRINPHPKYTYTKPILMLIDEMDFSTADLMPAILQDNHRALLFGRRTAGAGGYISSFQFPNSHGIALIAYTASIAERPDQRKIENLGVTPDIEYEITVNDLKNGYQGYITAVNSAVEQLMISNSERTGEHQLNCDHSAQKKKIRSEDSTEKCDSDDTNEKDEKNLSEDAESDDLSEEDENDQAAEQSNNSTKGGFFK